MSLSAAVGRVDVTPGVGGPLAGYGDRGPSTGVLAPIEAAVLLLDDGCGCRAGLVTLDAVGVGLAVAARLRERVAQAAGTTPDRVLLSCTHNHAGPDWFDVDGAERADADRMIDAVAALAASLPEALTPARVAVATGETGVAVNRRCIGEDGQAVMGVNEVGHVDRRVTTLVLTCDDEPGPAGAVLATVTVAALHGNCLKGDNTCLAPDFVGAFRQAMSDGTGAPSLFVQGCAGDLNPRRRGDWADAVATGRQLARDMLPGLRTAEPTSAALGAVTLPLQVPTRARPTDEGAAEVAATAARAWEADVTPWLEWHRDAPPGPQLLPADLTVIRVGDLALGAVPWELFSSVGVRGRAEAGEHALLCGYGNGYYGYLAEPHDIAHGGYEIDWQPVVYGVATGMPLPMADSAADLILDAFRRAVSRLVREDTA